MAEAVDLIVQRAEGDARPSFNDHCRTGL